MEVACASPLGRPGQLREITSIPTGLQILGEREVAYISLQPKTTPAIRIITPDHPCWSWPMGEAAPDTLMYPCARRAQLPMFAARSAAFVIDVLLFTCQVSISPNRASMHGVFMDS
jgi:hypothetical protein